jgi:hypothetical protein
MNATKIITLIAILIVAALFMPIIIIWSLNTLFPVLVIPYTFKTYIAAFVIATFLTGNGIKYTKK